MSVADELIEFIDEDEFKPRITDTEDFWKVMVVDDDEDVHNTTRFALKGVEILGRKLQIHDAYSAEEGRKKLETATGIAVVLLDVVMETDDAGLRLVHQIRDEMQIHDTRIILRTGQPGYAPEMETIASYDINDYKTKSELNRNKLFAALTTAIRSYDQLNRLDTSRKGLAQIIASSNQLLENPGLKEFSEGVITQLSSFIGVDPEGLVCAGFNKGVVNHQPEEFRVIAGAGRYLSGIGQTLDELDDPGIGSMLKDCLTQKQNILRDKGICIFFNSDASHEFAVYIESGSRIKDIDQELIELFCHNLSLCSKNVDLVERLQDYAFKDPLTGLANRNGFIQALNDQLARKKDDLVIVLIDIDQFSDTIDMFGHRYGDSVLKAFADRLKPVCQQDNFCLARIAGDTFAVYGSESLMRPEKIFPYILQPLLLEGGQEHAISASVGLVHADGNSAEDLVKDGFIALKHAKDHGSGQYSYLTQQMRDASSSRAQMLYGLRQDFDQQQLYLVYQPQIRLSDNSLVGLEALLRWQGPGQKQVPPDRFIPVAEKSGMIIGLGTWVLREALKAGHQLVKSGQKGLRMAVNVSALQIQHSQFLSVVKETLKQHPASDFELEMEITESVGVLGSEQLEQILKALKDLGISISIDDFGTGFSSLSYLDQLSADRLKIDRSFVSQLDAANPENSIAHTIIALGNRLGMQVLAEGVETGQQLEALQALGCNEVQGYHYARPMPLTELIKWLEQRKSQ